MTLLNTTKCFNDIRGIPRLPFVSQDVEQQNKLIATLMCVEVYKLWRSILSMLWYLCLSTSSYFEVLRRKLSPDVSTYYPYWVIHVRGK